MSGRLEIVELDPFDDRAVDAWHAAYLAADVHGREEVATPFQLEELRVVLQERGGGTRQLGFSGLVDGRVVTAAHLRVPLLDNLERAELTVHTVPGQRRRGYGVAVLEHVERVARGHGRRILASEAFWPPEAGPEGSGEPGPEFARRHGYELALGDVQRVLTLPVVDGLLERLAGEAAPHHAAYRLCSWVGPVPEDLVLSWAELSSSLITEAPTGELEVEPEAVDVPALREREAVVAKQGRTKYNTVALDGAGTVVAYTDLATTVHEPGRAYQWGTLVRRADRGHRLGIAVKVANLRLLQRERPDIHRLTTYNAEVNAPMVAVNELLGFVPVGRLGEFQKVLG